MVKILLEWYYITCHRNPRLLVVIVVLNWFEHQLPFWYLFVIWQHCNRSNEFRCYTLFSRNGQTSVSIIIIVSYNYETKYVDLKLDSLFSYPVYWPIYFSIISGVNIIRCFQHTISNIIVFYVVIKCLNMATLSH